MQRSEVRRRLGQRPNGVRFDDLREMLEAYGWRVVRVSGSHHVFQRSGDTFSVPFHRPHVRATYVRQAMALTEGEDSGDD